MQVKNVTFWGAILTLVVSAAAWGDGRIEGKVVTQEGRALGGVAVIVNETGATALTRNDGTFVISGVPAGTYTLSFSLAGDSITESGIEVQDGETTTIEQKTDWDLSYIETITVYSASRRVERIVDAPAAITTIPEEQIEREAPHGQVPKLLEFSPGVDATQSGVFDYNLNARGFNSSLNRRVVVLVDGRDPSVPFLSSQEWPTVSQYMNDLASAELVRGPSSALYGANAYNGVLNLTTKAPRNSTGGEVRLTAGSLENVRTGGESQFKGELRYAADLGDEWYLKLNGSYFEGGDFSVDRNVETEYPGLAREVIPRLLEDNEIAFGNLRFDKHLRRGDFFTFEGGTSTAESPVTQTGIGRFSITDIDRSWGRFNYTATHWNALAYYNDRESIQTNLQSAIPAFLDSENYKLELQTNWSFNRDRIRLVAGVSHLEEEIDTADDTGDQTLVFEPVDSDSQAAYGQLDFELAENLKLVLAGRYDESTLHDSQFSPKAALVWSVVPSQTLRFTYNEAFQRANYSEFFLYAPVGQFPGAQIDAAVCGPFGISCGLDPVIPVLASGNATLEVEEIESFEVGYTGIISQKVFLTVDYYNNQLENFITDLLPQLGTSLGQINPNLPLYTAPGVPDPILAALRATVAGLTGGQLTFGPAGDQAVVAVSYTNFGEVDTQGVDLGLNAYITPQWRVDFGYAWFDFDTKQELPDDPLVPNAPENKFNAGVAYLGNLFDVSVNYRWVDDFDWAVGSLFRGRVESYNVVDVNFNYNISDTWSVGVNVANLLDDDHYEAFGGDLVGRRALGNIAFRW